MKQNNKWWIFIGAGLMIFLSNLDATIVNLALATLGKDLHTNLTQMQWIINSYLLTTMIFFIIGGKLADLLSPERVFLIGTALFGGASLFAGLSQTFSMLLIARLIQGIGFAFTLSLALLMISNAFPVRQRGFALGLSVTITGLGQALGPTVGGAILETLSWHWTFLVNVPFALLSFMIILKTSKHTNKTNSTKLNLDYSGALILSILLTILLLTMNALSEAKVNWHDFSIGIILSVIFAFIFFYKEIKTKLPLFDFRLFLKRDYSLSIGIRFLFMYVFGTFLFFIPLYLQNILGYSPLFSGLILLVYSALFAISSPMAGVWSDQVGYKAPIFFSCLVCVLSFVILATLKDVPNINQILLGLSLYGLSCGILIPVTVTSTLADIPKENAGEGLGMFFTLAFLGTSLGVAIGGIQMNMVAANALTLQHAPSLLSHLKPEALDILHRVSTGALPSSKLKPLVSAEHFSAVSQLAQDSFSSGFRLIMATNAGLAVVACVLAKMLKVRTKSE